MNKNKTAKTLPKSVLKAKFNWDVSELAEYTDQEAQELYTREVLQGDTLSVIDTQENVKYKTKLKDVDVDVEWQDGSACGWTPQGEVKLQDKDIQAYPIKVNIPFCNLDLLETWANKALRAGAIAQLEEMPYRDAITAHMMKKQSKKLEFALWNETLAGGGYFDGFETIIAAEAANVIDLNPTNQATFTNQNAFDTIWAAFETMDADEQGAAVLETGAFVWLTDSQFNKFVFNVLKENLFHFDPKQAATDGEIDLPGTNIKVKRFRGRTDNNKFYITKSSNLVFGTDLSSDTLNLRQWYNEDEEEIRFKLRFNAGCQIRFAEEIGVWEMGGLTLPEGGE